MPSSNEFGIYSIYSTDFIREQYMAKDFSNIQVVQSYDQHIRKLIPGYELIHLQIQSLLHCLINEKRSAQATILIAGCGTGYELEYLVDLFPQAHFVALDPSAEMIEFAKKRLQHKSKITQMDWIVGDTTALHEYCEAHSINFDCILSILVSHFIQNGNKPQFLHDLYQSLNSGGVCLSYELTQIENQFEQNCLAQLALKTGLVQAQVDAMFQRLASDFALVSADEMQNLYLKAGFNKVKSFSQVLNYYGFIAYR